MGLPPTSNLRKKTTGFSRETMHLLNFLPHFHFPLFLFPCSEVFAFPQALFFFFLENVHKDTNSFPRSWLCYHFQEEVRLDSSLWVRNSVSWVTASTWASPPNAQGFTCPWDPSTRILSLITWIALNYDCLLVWVSLLIQLKLLVGLESSVSIIIFPAWSACSMRIHE